MIVARHFGPEGFGKWSMFYSILTIVLLFAQFGIDKSSRKYVAQYKGTNQLGAVLKSSISLRVQFTIVFMLAFLLFYKPMLTILGRNDIQNLFFMATPIILLSGITEYIKNIFQGLHRLKYNLFISVSEYGTKLLFTILILLYYDSLVAIVLSINFALLISTLTGVFLLYFYYYRKELITDNDYRKLIFKYSIPLFFTTAGMMIITEIDTVMLGILSTNKQVGLYAVPKQIIAKLPHIAFAISLGTMPVFAKLNMENKNVLKSLFMKLLKINALIFCSIGFILVAFGWLLIPYLFGSEYVESVLPLQILTVYLISLSFSFFLNAFLDYQGRAKKRAIHISVSVVLNIILNYLLIPSYGAIGASIATSISYLPYVILNWLEVRRTLSMIDNRPGL